MSASHPRIRQGKQRHHVRSILGQSTEAHLGVAELSFDHAEGVFNLRPYLSLAFLDLAFRLIQDTVLAMFLVGAAPSRDLPDNLATFMFRELFDAGIPGIGEHHVLAAVQQLVELGDIRDIRRRVPPSCAPSRNPRRRQYALSPQSSVGCPSWSDAFPGRAGRLCSWSNWAHGSAWHRRWCPGATTVLDRPGNHWSTPESLPLTHASPAGGGS